MPACASAIVTTLAIVASTPARRMVVRFIGCLAVFGGRGRGAWLLLDQPDPRCAATFPRLLLHDAEDPLHPQARVVATVLRVHEARLHVHAGLRGDRLL